MADEYEQYTEVEILLTFLLNGKEIHAVLPCAMKKEFVDKGLAKQLRLKELKVIVP